MLGATTFGVLALNKKGIVDLDIGKSVKDLREPWDRLQGNAKIIDNIVDKTKPLNTLLIGDSNSCHYLEFFTKVINLKYVELHGSLKYGKNVGATSKNYKENFDNLHSNVIKAISQMPDGSRVILANLWWMYDKNCKTRKNPILNVTPQYQDDVIGGIISDIENLSSEHHKLRFYVISQPVRPTKVELNPFINMYYLGTYHKYLKKVRELLGFSENEEFQPKNQNWVEEINARLKAFSDKNDNVYFIDRNTPVCKSKAECYVVINGKPLYTDIDHLSIYGGEIVGKYILKKIRETE